VRVLLERSAELDSRDNGGQTPLSWAATNGHEAMVRVLLEKGAELKIKDSLSQISLPSPDFDLDHDFLENTDVLEYFDYDSLLNTSNEDAFNFPIAVGSEEDFGIDTTNE
jgi:ankyrin repeat protein